MKKETPVQGLSIYSGLDLNLEEILALVEDQEWVGAEVSYSNGGPSSVDSTNRDSLIKRLKPYSDRVYPAIKPAMDDYLAENGFSDLEMQSFALVKYVEGGFFLEHIDGGADSTRKVSIVVYLNDDYEGGEIVFTRHGITLKPEKNSVVIFPSGGTFHHEAKPVLSGNKYIITSFWV